jgi:hypothetical protein
MEFPSEVYIKNKILNGLKIPYQNFSNVFYCQDNDLVASHRSRGGIFIYPYPSR